MKQVTGPGGIFALKLFILGLVVVILTIAAALLVRELHQWTAREKLKKTIFALTLFAVFATLVFAGEAALQRPEAGVPLSIFAALILAKAYESGKNIHCSGLFSKKVERETINLKKGPILLTCALVAIPCMLAFGAHCSGCCKSAAAVVWLSSAMVILVAIIIVAHIRSQ